MVKLCFLVTHPCETASALGRVTRTTSSSGGFIMVQQWFLLWRNTSKKSRSLQSYNIQKWPSPFQYRSEDIQAFCSSDSKMRIHGYLAACIPELPIVSPPEGIYTASWLHCFTLMSIHFFLLLLLSHTSAAK